MVAVTETTVFTIGIDATGTDGVCGKVIRGSSTPSLGRSPISSSNLTTGKGSAALFRSTWSTPRRAMSDSAGLSRLSRPHCSSSPPGVSPPRPPPATVASPAQGGHGDADLDVSALYAATAK